MPPAKASRTDLLVMQTFMKDPVTVTSMARVLAVPPAVTSVKVVENLG
jgi:hypothetical protein